MQQQQQKTRLRVKQKNEINKEYNNFPVHGGRARTREMHSLVEKKKNIEKNAKKTKYFKAQKTEIEE